MLHSSSLPLARMIHEMRLGLGFGLVGEAVDVLRGSTKVW